MSEAVGYSRERGASGAYADKFAGLIEACNKAKQIGADTLIVAAPWVLGDTYDELTESLSRMADAGLSLAVAQRNPPQ
jgi:hypothetical protein